MASTQNDQMASPATEILATIFARLIVVVKKTFRYSNVFFYHHLCRNSVIRNIIMESGINPIERIRLTMKARGFNNYVCKNEEKLLERLDQAILDVIDNPKKSQKTTAIGTLF